MFDRKIINDFKSNFYSNEYVLYGIYDEKEKISVYDVFQIGKIRNENILTQNKKFLNNFYSSFSSVQSISFSLIDNFSILISFINGKNGRIFLDKEGNLAFLYCTEFSKAEQKFILDTYTKELKDLIQFGMENNYDKHIDFKTISGGYDISLTSNRFSLYKPNNFNKITGKRIEFDYLYDQVKISSLKTNAIKTDLGIFNVRTNVVGINHILKATENNDSKLKMKNLLKHLQVYESEVPEYLREEIQKVKVLKK